MTLWKRSSRKAGASPLQRAATNCYASPNSSRNVSQLRSRIFMVIQRVSRLFARHAKVVSSSTSSRCYNDNKCRDENYGHLGESLNKSTNSRRLIMHPDGSFFLETELSRLPMIFAKSGTIQMTAISDALTIICCTINHEISSSLSCITRNDEICTWYVEILSSYLSWYSRDLL